MDLSRTKTILILAFLILNIYLGNQLWNKQEIFSFHNSITTQEINEVIRQLEESNYRVNISIPRQDPKTSLLSVMRPEYAEETLLKDFFPEVARDSILMREVNEEKIYSHGQESLTIKEKGQGTFVREISQQETENISRSEAQQHSQEYLKKMGTLFEDAVFDSAYDKGDNEKTVRYHQSYEGIPIYTSYINFFYTNGHLSRIDYYWLTPLDFTGENRSVIPGIRALGQFLEIKGTSEKPVELVSLTLGYYSREYDAQKWDMVPVWRVLTRSGDVFYINAFSGEEEGS